MPERALGERRGERGSRSRLSRGGMCRCAHLVENAALEGVGCAHLRNRLRTRRCIGQREDTRDCARDCRQGGRAEAGLGKARAVPARRWFEAARDGRTRLERDGDEHGCVLVPPVRRRRHGPGDEEDGERSESARETAGAGLTGQRGDRREQGVGGGRGGRRGGGGGGRRGLSGQI